MPKDSESPETPITLLRSAHQFNSAEPDSTPPGKLRMVITYLEMWKMPRYPRQSPRTENLSIIRARRPTVSFYRYLYNTVGEDWLWYERRQMSDKQLEQIIRHPKIKIYVLYVNGTPAGYNELDCRQKDEIELAYFGLIPDFIGRGLGSYFLRWTVERAWSEEPNRVWVHSCNFDAPYAITTYQKAGFQAYKQEDILIDDPQISEMDESKTV